MSEPLHRLRLQIPAQHPMFAGHFPGRPIVPGAWLLAQALQALAREAPEYGPGAYAAQVVKFHRPVPPDSTLDLVLARTPAGMHELVVTLHGELAATVRLVQAAQHR